MHRFRILVPVSFGDQSDIALRQAKSLAHQVNAMVTCLHVIEKPGIIGGKLIAKEMAQKVRIENEIKIASKVDAILSGNNGVSYEIIVTSGNVHSKILEEASELKIDMIIMGRADDKDSTKSALGTNASRVIERSTIPVLTVRDYQTPSYANILLPLDLSVSISLQLANAIEIAELLKAMVTVIAIMPLYGTKLEYAYKRRLIDIKKIFSQYDIFCRVKLLITEKGVADEILSCSKNYHPSMLFIMTQKESEIDDLSIGSVADKLIRRSDIPVLSVTPVIQNDHYPFRALFGSINQPIDWFDLNDHLITAD